MEHDALVHVAGHAGKPKGLWIRDTCTKKRLYAYDFDKVDTMYVVNFFTNARISGPRARGDGGVIDADRTDRESNADGGKRVRHREKNVEAAALVEVRKVSCQLLRVIVVRHATIFVAVMLIHDQFNVLGVVLDERSFALLALSSMSEVTLRPRQ